MLKPRVSVLGFQFEPRRECSAAEISLTGENTYEADEIYGDGKLTCTCGKCKAMATDEENVCCRSLNIHQIQELEGI